MKGSPRSLTRRAPSPRSASDMRKRGAPVTFSAVGWNWTNSRSASCAPARDASAMPSPVATAGVETATNAVGRFASQRDATVRFAVERRPPVDQLANVARSLLDEHADRLFIAQSITGADRIRGVPGRTVVVADRHGDAALRV